MRISTSRRLFLREIVIPLLCAVMALWGIAQARAGASKLADPAHAAAFLLCTPMSATGGSDAPPDHDCGNCCLPNTVSPTEHRVALPLRLAVVLAQAPGIATIASGRILTDLPWSRGPPDRA